MSLIMVRGDCLYGLLTVNLTVTKYTYRYTSCYISSQDRTQWPTYQQIVGQRPKKWTFLGPTPVKSDHTLGPARKKESFDSIPTKPDLKFFLKLKPGPIFCEYIPPFFFPCMLLHACRAFVAKVAPRYLTSIDNGNSVFPMLMRFSSSFLFTWTLYSVAQQRG